MTNQTKSLIRHTLTALGVLLAALGLTDASNVANELLMQLDPLWDAILVVAGVFTTVIGFFQNKDRFVGEDKPIE